MTHSILVLDSQRQAKPSALRGRFAGLAACLALALATNGCDDGMGHHVDCPANPGLTQSLSQATPGGMTAQGLRAGLQRGPSATMTLHRVHTQEDTRIPKRVSPKDDGVVFDLAGAEKSLDVTVEILPREEGLRFRSVGVTCSASECPEPYRCIERSSLAVDVHVRAVDGSFESVMPVDLVYYPEDQRKLAPMGDSSQGGQIKGKHVFFGRGRVDESKARGALRLVNPRTYRGQGIKSAGFGVRVGVIDQRIVSFDLTASFELEPGESGFTAQSQPIYSSVR